VVATLIAAITIGATGLAGCARSGDDDGGSDEPAGAPPPGVSVSLHQFRVDQVARRLLVGIRNDGPKPLFVSDLQLISRSFATIKPTRFEQTLEPTPRVDLSIPFGTARCHATRIPQIGPSAVLARLRGADGETRKVRFPLPHPEPLLRQILESECGTYIVRQTFEVGFGTSWRPETGEDRKVLRGTVMLRRTGRGAPVEITGLAGNPHFNLTFVDAKPPFSVPPGAGEVALPVDIAPARCDPHAFAEAKTAQRYVLIARLPGAGAKQYTVPFESAGGVRAGFDAFARQACDIPAS
jgi:hypothetical protein